MIGSIIGDTVGSIYEFNNIKTKTFDFWDYGMEPTDDSVLTFATADWILHGGEAWKHYYEYAREYDDPSGGYGGSFLRYVQNIAKGGEPRPYNSCGNGSAMRVAPVGWAFETRQEVLAAAKMSAECTHNHPEGVKGAEATALAIFMARKGASKEEIKTMMEAEYGYSLDFTLDELRPAYSWRFQGAALCQGTVPQAFRCVYEAADFEDCIRNAVSLGGDSDTLACIAGGIAEAVFGVPKKFYDYEVKLLKARYPKFVGLLREFERKFGSGVV